MVLAKHRLKGLFIHVTSRDVVWLFEEKTETSKVNLFVECLASLFPWRIHTFVDEKFWKWRRSKDIFLINYVNIFCRPIEKLNCNINISNICWNFYFRTTLTSNDVTFLMECTCIIKAWIILCGMGSKVFNTDASCFEHILTYSNIIHCCLFSVSISETTWFILQSIFYSLPRKNRLSLLSTVTAKRFLNSALYRNCFKGRTINNSGNAPFSYLWSEDVVTKD